MWWPRFVIHIVIFLLATTIGTIWCNPQIFSAEQPIVETTAGRIQGHTKNTLVNGKLYYAFQGIPFAEPPVGTRRFQPPYPKESWTGTLVTVKDGPACPQGSDPVIGQEDCLNLNVFTPSIDGGRKLSVMVWIFGGGFAGGSPNTTLFGPDFFIEQDIIICHINYRLGIFGFLSTGDNVVPGNNGLRDQIEALRWIRANIERFGGDPDSITLFGQSAGSASVSLQLQIEQSKGLFQRAIMQSGSSLCLWSRSREPREIAFAIGDKVELNTNSSTVLIEEFRKLDYQSLQTTSLAVLQNRILSGNPRDGFSFAPVIETDHTDALITSKSHERMTKGQFNKIPSIIGFNTLEGTFELGALLRIYFAKYDLQPAGLVPVDMNIADSETKSTIGRKIKLKYFGLVPVSLSEVNIMKFLSIDQFVRPITEFTRLMSKHTNTYFYVFSHEGALWGYRNRTTPGTTHSEELGYIWPSMHEDVATQQDILTRNRIIRLWANFAKSGNPSPGQEELLQNILWPTTQNTQNGSLNYLDIGLNLEVKRNPFDGDIIYWNDLYNEFANGPFDTY